MGADQKASGMDTAGDHEPDDVVAPRVFIVRAWRDAAGRVSGVVERVATGEKARFEEADALAGVIQRMVTGPAES